MSTDFDAVVIGAGCVGLATARALALAGRRVVVLEKERRIGSGVSARNSEVIHSGVHYPPGSLKAQFCVRGRRLLYAYLSQRGVAHDRCGKLIVATEESELAALHDLETRAEANDVEGVIRLGPRQALALEPELRVAGALGCAESGILDAHGYMDALAGDIEDAGGVIARETPFVRAVRLGEQIRVSIGGADPADITTRALIVAAGLDAQACAAAIEGFPEERIPALHYGKGNYFALSGRAPFRRLVYPPPIPGALGIHYRRDLGGQARFGPDLEFVEAPDYRVNADRLAYFEAYVRRFWPGLPDNALTPDYAGVRPKLHGPGEPQSDFVIDSGMHGVIALFGIESPGLTSSLAIGEHVARLAQR